MKRDTSLGEVKLFTNRIDKVAEEHIYAYCSQSKYFEKEKTTKRIRHNYGFQKFECSGQLYIHKSESYISIKISHTLAHLEAIKDLSDHLVEQIKEMSLCKTPGDIFRDLKTRQGSDEYLQLSLSQVSYIWTKATGMRETLSEADILEKHNFSQIILDDIQQGHILFMTEFINLDSSYIIVDSTFKTNKENFELFVVILLFEGEGYPGSYFYLQRKASEGQRKSAIESWYLLLLTQRFKCLKKSGVNPRFIKMDKDDGQIQAASSAWPQSTVNLCLWHILRAIKKRLKDPREVCSIFNLLDYQTGRFFKVRRNCNKKENICP